MNILLIGATGFVGTVILNEALNRDHKITAVARHTEKISITDENITVKAADILKQNEAVEVIKGHDAIISAYNPDWNDPDIYDNYKKGYRSIFEGMHKTEVKRIIMIGGAGSLYIKPGMQLIDSPEFPKEWKQGALAARDVLKEIQNDNYLEWTFVSPAVQLVQGKRTGNFRYGVDEILYDDNGNSSISVQDLAVAVLDELENTKHLRKRFTVAY